MERKQPIPNQHIWKYLNEINALYQWVHSTYKITLSEITITGFRTEITDLLKSSPSLEWICFWGTSTLTWHGGLFEVLVLCSCRLKFSWRPQLCRICHICRYAAGTLRSTSWSSLQRVLLGEDNALRGICVLILTSHRHQHCGGCRHFVWNKFHTKHDEWARLAALRSELRPNSSIPPTCDVGWSGSPHETLTLKAH